MKIPKVLKSVRMRLFLSLTIVVIITIVFLILLNNIVLETYYLHSKKNSLLTVYSQINNYYNDLKDDSNIDLELELDKVALNNNFDLIIKTPEGINVFSSNKNFLENIGQIAEMQQEGKSNVGNSLYESEKVHIKKVKDKKTNLSLILLSAKLDNGYILYIRLPIASIQESVRISNNFLLSVGSFTILIGGIAVSFISNKFTKPIYELNNIAKRMANLDFTKKYNVKENEDDEINDLGKSINILSDTLEKTINQLKEANVELEKDIEHKSKIDEMRKQFISDVSHELKTPIALIQGYAEGLEENITADEESKKFYIGVILDEANKMDKLVKQLLELMKLEYGKREFNNTNFDIIELVNEVIRKTTVMREEKKIQVKFECPKPVHVFADEFYIEQVVTNYMTNAIKHAEPKNNENYIKIRVEERTNNKVRIYVYNTGEQISMENQNRIWNRFYKIDASRKREDGGTGIGLSLVKAIMNNYKNAYGVCNRENGVEFYFDLDLA